MSKLVIGDLHGNLKALRDILIRSGAVKNWPIREPGWTIIQLGDLLNMAPEGQDFHGFKSNDYEMMSYVNEYKLVDKILIGNHEAWFTHGLESGKWAGMARLEQLHPELMRQINFGMFQHGYYSTFAEVVHGYVISHAGLLPKYVSQLGKSPQQAVDHINFDSFPEIIDNDYDGILWTRKMGVLKALDGYWPQIIGHTPELENPRFYQYCQTWMIDNGGYVADHGSGIVWNEGLKVWVPIP
jgi:hypothetical protein